MIKVPRLKLNRHGVYCVRVYWRDATGKLRETLLSLSTKDPQQARILALQFNASIERQRATMPTSRKPTLDDLAHKYELDLSKGIMKSDGTPEDHDRLMQAIAEYKSLYGTFPPLQEAMAFGRGIERFTPLAPRARSMPFSEATAAYLLEKQQDNAAQTLVEKGRTYKDFIGIFGDLELNLYTKAEIVQWKTADLKRGLGANRINKRLGQVNDFFKWAIAHGHYTVHPTSPVEGLFISNKHKLSAKTEHYEAFTNDELASIFSKAYLDDMVKPDHYWLPLVALYSGARREEIASLKAANVKTIDGVPCFQIEEGKTADARRVVPLHRALIDLGFMAYAEHVQSLGEEMLFPHLIDGPNGRGKNAGRQFAVLLDRRGITNDRKVFHSFRHTVVTQLHTLKTPPIHAMQITGHISEEVKGVHYQTYTHGMGLQTLAESLGRLSYPIDLDALKLSDPTFKKFLTRAKSRIVRESRARKFQL